MRKKNFLMLLGLAGFGLTAQAQVIATLGFEDGDQFYHHKDSTQFCGLFTVTTSISNPGMCGMRSVKSPIRASMPWRRTTPIRYRVPNGFVV